MAPRSPPEEGASTREPGEERSRSCRTDPMAASVQFCWPSAFRNLAVCVQDLVAADTLVCLQREGDTAIRASAFNGELAP